MIKIVQPIAKEECCLASGGKHLRQQANIKRGSGAHLSEKDRRRAAVRRSRGAARRGRFRHGAPQMIAMLLLCIVMISPLRSCIISDSDYIGYAAARETALSDAGITQDKAKDLSAEMIKIGDTVCYKVQFTGSVTEYRYIIDASSGLIIGQTFYRTEG